MCDIYRMIRTLSVAAALFAVPAAAEVVQSTPAGFEVSHSVTVPVSLERAWPIATAPRLWWDKDHTYSGDPATLTLDERPGGFALTRAIAGEAELLLLATEPGARRQGVGAALLRAVIDGARDRGAGRLHLEMRAKNPASALYRQHGFAQVGERREYYRGGDGKRRDAQTWARDL